MRETIWQFETRRFRVALEIEPEDMDPADSFEFQEDIDAIRNGDVEWFQAMVAVYYKPNRGPDIRIGFDTLGACAYKTLCEFYTSHHDPDPMNRNCSIMRAKGGNYTICHYFPSMVREAIAQARRNTTNMCILKV